MVRSLILGIVLVLVVVIATNAIARFLEKKLIDRENIDDCA